MKKVYSLLTLLVLAMTAMTAAASKTVNVSCNFIDAIELRDGSADGPALTFEADGMDVTFESDALYIGLTDDSKLIRQVYYTCTDGWQKYMTAPNGYCIIPVSDMYEGNVTITITVGNPRFYYINIPDPSLITIKPSSYSDDSFVLTEGLNTFKVEEYGSLYVCVNDPENYKMTRFWRVSDGMDLKVNNYTDCDIYAYDTNSGDEFSYTIVPASEFECPTFTITVDNPEEVDVQVEWNQVSGFVANEPKTIEMTGSTARVSVRHVVYDEDLFQVTHNGNTVDPTWGSYNITASPDDEIVVTAAFPEIYKTVTITSDPAENAAVIYNVTGNNTPVEDWSEPFQVKQGKKVAFNLNSDLYEIKSVTVNGEPAGTSSSFSTKVTDDLNIVVTSEKYATLTATLVVNDPACVRAKLNNNDLTLVEGENLIEFTKNANSLVLAAMPRYTLNSVTTTLNGETQDANMSYSGYFVTLEDGMEINIDGTAWELDKQVVVYSTHAYDDPTFMRFVLQSSGSYIQHELAAGYNTIDFCDAEKNMTFSGYDANYNNIDPLNIYVNGNAVQGSWGQYSFVIEHGDVVKIYALTDPVTCSASFDIEEGVDMEIVKDLYITVDPAEGVIDFEGTLVQLKKGENSADTSIEVYVATVVTESNEALEPALLEADENGVYNITLDTSKAVTVCKAPESGVEGVIAAGAANTGNVYTLTGVQVLTNATKAQINTLPSGIYVMNGQKIVVR